MSMRHSQSPVRSSRSRKRIVAGAAAGALALGGVLAAAAPAAALVGWGDPASCTDSPMSTLGDLRNAITNHTPPSSEAGPVYLGTGASLASDGGGIDIPVGTPITIDLCGGDVAIATNGPAAGIHVPVGAALTIQDSVGGGSLDVDLSGAAYAGAAIGGGIGEGAGSITIDSGDVTAKIAEYAGAAVGGGYGGHGLTSSGTTVAGNGGVGGAGGAITVNGGSLTAITTEIYSGAAIGGGYGGLAGVNLDDPQLSGAGGDGGDGGSLTVNGGTVTAVAVDDIYGATAIGGGSGGPSPTGSYGASGGGAAVTVNGGTLAAQGRYATIGAGTDYGTPGTSFGSLTIAGHWIDGVTPTRPAATLVASTPVVTTTGAASRFTLTNGTSGGSLTTRIEFVDALVDVTPSATTAELGDTITVTALAHVPSGATFDVSGALVLSSDVPQDATSGNTVTFLHASTHTITASYGGVSTSFAVEVADDPAPALADTGVDPLLAIWLAALLLLAGAALATWRTIRLDRAS